MNIISVLIFCFGLLLSSITTATEMNQLIEYMAQRPIIKKSMYVRIAIMHEAKHLARSDGIKPTSDEFKRKGAQYGAKAVALLKQRCTEGTLTKNNGNPESDCKIIHQIKN
ncbi:MAG: hypothetical protein KA214_07200 [Neisseriaceae bacterium]|nr:hypothetical protein [Neisseriaceae bacterium]